MLKIALICGGPSLERGISLNSARSFLDHVPNDGIEVLPLYVDYNKNFYTLNSSKLYSNTPSDFDFKLDEISTKLDYNSLKTFLKNVDLVVPIIHGPFGEDGELQELLEGLNVPFVGLNSACCKKLFKKHHAHNELKKNGFNTPIFIALEKNKEDSHEKIKQFFSENNISRAIVKPSSGGSSIGVYSVSTSEEAFAKTEQIFNSNLDHHVIIEPFFEGKEFTVLIFQNPEGAPVALIPTEIELCYDNHEILDYRKKYLPTTHATYHTPARFSLDVINEVRLEAEKIFSLFGLRDFIRMDGWITNDNKIYFTDINPICGFEQQSFLFKQSSLIGLTHADTFYYIIKNACRRYNILFPQTNLSLDTAKKPLFVLFGGQNAERQVSLMSGTNVWLKLLKSKLYSPTPFLYDLNKSIWKLPYKYALKHTVEEICSDCQSSIVTLDKYTDLIKSVLHQLCLNNKDIELPEKMSLDHFIDLAKDKGAFIFIGLHGGEGEDGTLQKLFDENNLNYNGSRPEGSSLCMDKYQTGLVISESNLPYISSLPKIVLSFEEIKDLAERSLDHLWSKLTSELHDSKVIIKPRKDGCSAGIVILQSAKELSLYFNFLCQNAKQLAPNTFSHQTTPIEMPSDHSGGYIIEPYITTDLIEIKGHTLKHTITNGWIELTVGVLEEQGKYHALNPSITVAEGAVLSLEEKFQGGTGVNLTPPPVEIISESALTHIKLLIQDTAKTLSIENYARIDIFYNHISNKIIVIEANSLPGLTPSTVIYHQALAEIPPIYPREFLERIIETKHSRVTSNV